MKNKFRIKHIIVILSLFASSLPAQVCIYQSGDATLQVNGEFNSKYLHSETRDIKMILDYESTELVIRFPLNSLISNIDTINSILKSIRSEVVFKGLLSLEYINTKSHPPQDFTVDGMLTIGINSVNITGDGTLTHVNDSGNMACLLEAVFYLDLKDLGIIEPFSDLKNDIEVIITQALLRNNKF